MAKPPSVNRGLSTTERGLGGEWQQLTAQARKLYAPICHVCMLPIDLTLPPNDRLAWTLDHLKPRATHGVAVPHIEDTRPAHRACNSGRGARETKPRSYMKL